MGAYLADKAGSLKHSSLKRRLSAIVAAHRQAGHKLDTKHSAIVNVLVGIRRKYDQTVTKKKPLLTSDLLTWLTYSPKDTEGFLVKNHRGMKVQMKPQSSQRNAKECGADRVPLASLCGLCG